MAKRDEEKELFVVSDRRKFTAEGERREDADEPVEENAASAVPAAVSAPAAEAPVAETAPAGPPQVPPPPSAAEQNAQKGEYDSASSRMDTMLDEHGAKVPAELTPSFETLTMSLYMQAMMELGMIREENTPPRPDPLRARHTIDMIAMLQDKTQGNLTERETHLLQNILFELRMAFLEVMKVLTTPPPPGAPAPQK